MLNIIILITIIIIIVIVLIIEYFNIKSHMNAYTQIH